MINPEFTELKRSKKVSVKIFISVINLMLLSVFLFSCSKKEPLSKSQLLEYIWGNRDDIEYIVLLEDVSDIGPWLKENKKDPVVSVLYTETDEKLTNINLDKVDEYEFKLLYGPEAELKKLSFYKINDYWTLGQVVNKPDKKEYVMVQQYVSADKGTRIFRFLFEMPELQ